MRAAVATSEEKVAAAAAERTTLLGEMERQRDALSKARRAASVAQGQLAVSGRSLKSLERKQARTSSDRDKLQVRAPKRKKTDR
eukprot:5166535-Pyramimonas_sp.AAC.1